MTQNGSEFSFPGFRLIGSRDLDKVTEITGKMEIGEQVFDITLVRSHKAPEWATFLPANVKQSGKVVWNFQDEGFTNGIGRLAMAGNIPVVALVQVGRPDKVIRIISLEDMPHLQRIHVGDKTMTIGGKRTVLEAAILKK